MGQRSAVRQAMAPSPPLGAERAGVRWGNHGARGDTHLTLTLSPLKGGEGKCGSSCEPLLSAPAEDS
jgi:hypothetical protein